MGVSAGPEPWGWWPETPEQIVVTSGALSGIAIVARALSRPGERIMIESPVYSNAIEALRLGGGQLVSSPLADPLGDAGWDIDEIEATLRQTSPRLELGRASCRERVVPYV